MRARAFLGLAACLVLMGGCRDRSPTPPGANSVLERSGIASSPTVIPASAPAPFAGARDYQAYLEQTGNFPASAYVR